MKEPICQISNLPTNADHNRCFGRTIPTPFSLISCACAFVLFATVLASSQSSVAAGQFSPKDLVRAVIETELSTQAVDDAHWSYQVTREEQGKISQKQVIQTAQGSIDRLVSVDTHPLTSSQEEQEAKRIRHVMNDLTQQLRLQQEKRKEAEQCKELFKMFPEAFIFSYAGNEMNLVKLSYIPNPSFQPPSREAKVFHELQGEMWVEPSQRRLVRMRGQLIADVKFGGGLLGYLQKGGHFDVQQSEISPHHWEVTSLDIQMQGKALLLKTIAVQEKECRTNFRAVPSDLSLAQAADMLSKRVILAANR